MKRPMGVLSMSLTALGLAVASYLAQGQSLPPVSVAEFSTPAQNVASADMGGEYDVLSSEDELFHPTATKDAAHPCADETELTTLTIAKGIAAVCFEGETVAYVLAAPGQKLRLFVTPEAMKKNAAPATTDLAVPAA